MTSRLVVNDEGSSVVAADEVAEIGFQPGQRVSATFSTVDRKPSRGLLEGHFPSLTRWGRVHRGQPVP